MEVTSIKQQAANAAMQIFESNGAGTDAEPMLSPTRQQRQLEYGHSQVIGFEVQVGTNPPGFGQILVTKFLPNPIF